MKIKIPFKMFGDVEGNIEIEIPIEVDYSLTREEIEEQAIIHAEAVGRYLGAFRDKFQNTILGYERCPGIGMLFWELNRYRDDEILRDRLMELLRESRERRTDDEATT